ncbi:MAG: UDP-3-O-(3-hydroxymyristoyl)glucosamine N-acyltransferase [Gammaproteobacteria bacterium]|nr:UDP-3-O-(3-hydroxymyristoyl)glucosamine N-acyltransferase [Gammaproteobacteria bacterium]
MSMTLRQLADALQLEFRGDAETPISGVASLAAAGASDLCFIQQRKYLARLEASRCAAVIVSENLAASLERPLLLSAEPHYSFVRAIEVLGLAATDAAPGVDPSARVAASARIDESASIGPLCVIGDDVEIGAGTHIGAAVVIERGVRIGADCTIHSRVTLSGSAQIGDRCILHPGSVVGADGFGLVEHAEAWKKIPHLGSVRIDDDVEIGANTTVDRGALDDTVIEQGCKLDNQIQVGHNVHIGAHTAIAGCVGIAGSARIGRYCKISGGAGILGHLQVADHVTITAMSLVTRDIREPGVYSSGTPLLENRLWLRNSSRYKSLEQLAQRVDRLEKNGK